MIRKGRVNRAAQFLPFDALKGLSEELQMREEILSRVAKKELSEDDAAAINEVINKIDYGSYDQGHYYDIVCLVEKKDIVYDSNLITEDEFRRKLSKCLSNLSSRKGWKYIGVWELSPEKKRLHFHGVFNIPEGAMVGEMTERQDYSFSEHRRKKTNENSFFKERFGRNDFNPIEDISQIDTSIKYLLKYIEKAGEKIVYSRGLPQFFISDIMDDDIICRTGIEDKKLLLFDNSKCWDDGEYIGEASPETISKMRKSN